MIISPSYSYLLSLAQNPTFSFASHPEASIESWKNLNYKFIPRNIANKLLKSVYALNDIYYNLDEFLTFFYVYFNKKVE